MNIFSSLYVYCLKLSKHRLAPWFLCLDSFIESIFFPIPPDVMLAPMCLATPRRAWYYAFITTASSVVGAFFGYYLGFDLYDPYISDLIDLWHYRGAMDTVRHWFTYEFGILMVFIGAFTPIPYKVIAITSGVVAAESIQATGSAGQLNIFYFLLVSCGGRGMRFFLEALLIVWGGQRMEQALLRYIDRIGWLCVLLAAAYIGYRIYA